MKFDLHSIFDLQVPYVLQEEVVTEIPQQQVVEVKREETPES